MAKTKKNFSIPYLQLGIMGALLIGLAGFVYLIMNGDVLNLNSQAAKVKLRCAESCNSDRECESYSKNTATGEIIPMHCYTGRYGRHSVGDGTRTTQYRGTCAPRSLRPTSRIQIYEACRGLEPFKKTGVSPYISPRPTSSAVNRFRQPAEKKVTSACNDFCTSDSNCQAQHFCYSFSEDGKPVKRCRSRICRADDDCVCDARAK